ncbi:MAG: EscU/YscU/HrcU family type III secretion system export apparatus switch protein [Janthinobacterium lividum]
MADADEKTEAPTDKRRREAAAKGEVLQSRDLATALLIGAGVAWLGVSGGALVTACRTMLRDGLTLAGPAGSLDPGTAFAALASGLVPPLAALAAMIAAAAVAGPLLISRHFSPGAVAPKLSRVDPVAGLKRLFGSQGLVELAKSVLKAGLLFGTGIAVLANGLPVLLTLGSADPDAAAMRIGGVLGRLMLALTLVLVLLAAIDFPIQLLRHLGRMRMSKQEVKEESRESEGSPETRAAQRRMARMAARRALAPAMAEASVVVVNPSEFAVALRYVPGRDAAPIIVAKGRDVIAAAIRDLAGERNVPVLRYPQLTRAIYFTGKVGAPIRDDLFAAVAAVLAFIFSLDVAAAAREQPDVEVPAGFRFDERGGVE